MNMHFNIKKGVMILQLPDAATPEDIPDIEQAISLQLKSWKRFVIERDARWPFPLETEKEIDAYLRALR